MHAVHLSLVLSFIAVVAFVVTGLVGLAVLISDDACSKSHATASAEVFVGLFGALLSSLFGVASVVYLHACGRGGAAAILPSNEGAV